MASCTPPPPSDLLPDLAMRNAADRAGFRASLMNRFAGRKARVVVIGLGHVGMPLAVAAAEAGHSVLGLDVSEERIRRVNSAAVDLDGAIARRRLRELLSAGALRASDDHGLMREADVVLVAVPTPLDRFRVPDLVPLEGAVRTLADEVRRGALVVLESTSFPGTTEELLEPALRRAGLTPGTDVFVGYSPARIDPGNPRWSLANTPKLVSGLTEDCLTVALAFYRTFIETPVAVAGTRTAEMAKLFENIFRMVNVALVNEFQGVCEEFGVDVWEVLDACSTKPYGFMTFAPGPGPGGHCLPVDPHYLQWRALARHAGMQFIELATRVNEAMPVRVVARTVALLNARGRSLRGSRVCVLGVAYKRNSSDVRESPAMRVLALLVQGGAAVSYHDPHVPCLPTASGILESALLDEGFIARQDCFIVLTDHDDIDWSQFEEGVLVVDTRNVLARYPNGRRMECAGSGPTGDVA